MALKIAIDYLIMTITGVLITLVLVPFLLPLAILFGVICLLSQWAIKLKYGNKAYKARGTDVVHGKESPRTLPVINVCVRVRGELNIKLICERTLFIILNTYNKNGMRRYKRLMETYGKDFGYNVWKSCSEFNIENHVHEIQMNDFNYHYLNTCKKTEQRNYEIGLEENVRQSDWTAFLENLLQKYGMKPFEENRPPWEILLARNDAQSYTVLYRFHHAIADGVYLSRMFCEDFLDEPHALFAKFKQPNPFQRFITILWSFCLLPFGLWTILSKHDRNPLHGPDLTGRKRFFTSDRMSLDCVASIKSKSFTKTSLHSIVFSCISYSISRHFERRKSCIPQITALTPLPLQNKLHQIKMKNKFAVGSINFPVSSDQKLQELLNGRCDENENYPAYGRLRLVQNCLEEMGRNISVLPTNSLINGFCSILPVAIAEALLSVKGCTTVISHLPGAKTEAKLYNGVIIDHMFWVPDREPLGIGFSAYSYNGHIRVGILVDEALIGSEEEGHLMIADTEGYVRNLIQECLKRKNASTDDIC